MKVITDRLGVVYSKVISDAGVSPQIRTDNPARNNYVPEGLVQVGIAYTNGQLYIRGVFKKRPKFLNSPPTSLESALRILSAPSFWF